MMFNKAVLEVVKTILLPEIGKINSRLDYLTGRVEELSQRVTDIHNYLIGMQQRMDTWDQAWDNRFSALEQRMDTRGLAWDNRFSALEQRMDRLYEVIVRREEHEDLRTRMTLLETEVSKIKEKVSV